MHGLTNAGGNVGGGSGVPDFSYDGDFEIVNELEKSWKIRFLSTGTLTINALKGASKGVDLFLVGGGGGTRAQYSAGAGGGYTKTVKNINISPGSYEIIVGAGGIAQNNGGESRAFGHKAAGGCSPGIDGTSISAGGNGGSGGGRYNNAAAANGGSDGGNGDGGAAGTTNAAGIGQIELAGPNGETGITREFGEADGELYSGGGGGGTSGKGGAGGGGSGTNNTTGSGDAAPNTGGGAGGHYSRTGGGIGGSGIVIIRNARGT